MLAYQNMVASDGYEVLLFPLEYLYMSQDEGGSYSHLYTYSIDFLGWGSNGRIYHCPYYAPCTCKCVQATNGGSNRRVYQSVDKVHCPDGYFGIVCFDCLHDNNPITSLNQIIHQGDLLGHTGTASGSGNLTGDHLHFNIAENVFNGFYDVGTGHYQLVGATHIYDTCYVNDTIIRNGYGHPWKTYDGSIQPPVTYHRSKFKWVLYANKLRNFRY